MKSELKIPADDLPEPTGMEKVMDTKTAETKRREATFAIDALLKPFSNVVGVVVVGSVATGTVKPTSDLDMVVFMDPVDRFIVPAESIWCPWDNTFHSPFTEDQKVQEDGLHLDIKHRDFREWASDSFLWPEVDRAGLTVGWIAFDRNGKLEDLIRQRTSLDDTTRRTRLDTLVLAVGEGLDKVNLIKVWDRYGPLIAYGRLAAALDSLVSGLLAYNGRWRFFRDREMEQLLALPWLPKEFDRKLMVAIGGRSEDRNDYMSRGTALRDIGEDIVLRLKEEGLYGTDPVSEAFIRLHDEPGRAWNMDEWIAKRQTNRRKMT